MTGAQLKAFVSDLPDDVEVYIDSNEGGIIYPARQGDVERAIQLQSLTFHKGEWDYTMRLKMNDVDVESATRKPAIVIATT